MEILVIIILVWYILKLTSGIERRKEFKKLPFHEQERMKANAWKKFFWWSIILFIFALIFRDF